MTVGEEEGGREWGRQRHKNKDESSLALLLSEDLWLLHSGAVVLLLGEGLWLLHGGDVVLLLDEGLWLLHSGAVALLCCGGVGVRLLCCRGHYTIQVYFHLKFVHTGINKEKYVYLKQ